MGQLQAETMSRPGSKKCCHDINKLKFNRNTKFFNLSSEGWSALKSLKKRKYTVIKAADKGGAVVVWRADLYQKLSDTSFYVKIVKYLTLINQNIVRNTIDDLIAKQELPATAKNLTITTPRAPCIDFLPKIHKPNNPGRPIVSTCSCHTELISIYLAYQRTSNHQATIKGHVQRYVNEGNNVLTPADFKDTILSHDGVNGVTVALVDTVIDETVAMQGKWKGISTLNSSSYTNNGESVTVWRAYNVGKGKTLQWSKVPGENQYEIILDCTTAIYKLKIYMVLCNVKIYIRNFNIQCFSI